MFGQLIKHEFRATARGIPLIFLIMTVISSVTLVLVYFNLKLLSALAVLVVVVLGVAQIFLVLALVLWRYYKSMYGKQAYLTHTLPVTASQLYLSKLLIGVVWIAFSYLIFLGVMVCAFLTMHRMDTGSFPMISNMWQSVLAEFGMVDRGPLFIIVVLMIFLLTIIFSLIQYYFAITLGSVSKLHRFGLVSPVIIYIIQYLTLQGLYIVGLMAFPAGLKIDYDGVGQLEVSGVTGNMLNYVDNQIVSFSSTMPVFNYASVDTDIFIILDAGYFIITPIVFFGLFFSTVWLIRKHTSLK